MQEEEGSKLSLPTGGKGNSHIYTLVIIHTRVREVNGSFSPIKTTDVELLGQAERLYCSVLSHTPCVFLSYFLYRQVYSHTHIKKHREHYRD